VIDDEPAVVPGRTAVAEGTIEQNLARGGLEQIGAADDFSNPHFKIVGYAGKLVAGHTVATPNDEIAEVFAGDKALRSEIAIVELDGLAVGNAETPVVSLRSFNVAYRRAGQLGARAMSWRQVPG